MENDYSQKVKERFKKYTLGFTLIVSYSIGNNQKVDTYSFSTKKQFNEHYLSWKSFFESESETAQKDGRNYSYLVSVYRNLVFNELGLAQLQASTYEEAMEELE